MDPKNTGIADMTALTTRYLFYSLIPHKEKKDRHHMIEDKQKNSNCKKKKKKSSLKSHWLIKNSANKATSRVSCGDGYQQTSEMQKIFPGLNSFP